MLTPEQIAAAERIPLREAYPRIGTIARRVARENTPVALTDHGDDLVYLVSATYAPPRNVLSDYGERGSSGGRRGGSVRCQSCHATAELVGKPDELGEQLEAWITTHTDPAHIQPPTPAAA